MRPIPDDDRQQVVEMYTNGMKITDIIQESGHCKETVYRILREANVIGEGHLNEADRKWFLCRWSEVQRIWAALQKTRPTGKYRRVRKGDQGIRTPYRPDGKFQ